MAQALAMSSATRRSHHFSAMSAACSVPMEGKNGSLSLSEATGLAAATFAAGLSALLHRLSPDATASLSRPSSFWENAVAGFRMQSACSVLGIIC